ncbi:MAG: DUF4249 domain-containing protein [Saprospiraceae bacterium]|uniref:DUF4249 domain-containing protein n=1 Tax=Candidatus Opimibacter skivensis TaxID=2982028 RepID=A0A9D7XRN5_9BACT|nr:DUF4249 domain-containing protein [Candidatus Opimibacter skivensis]
MRRIDIFLYMMWIVVLSTSCIKNFEPDILTSDAKKYVVTGQVAAGDSLQRVNVSLTSPINEPEYIPVPGCEVNIYDDKGHQFSLNDAGKGDYTVVIDPVFFAPGVSFKVEIKTPAGDMLVSDYDSLTQVPPIDSIYYQRKDIERSEPGDFLMGIQFYVDLKGTETSSRYFRWEEFETWEYHADYPLEWYYDGTVHHVFPPDFSRKVCWTTRKLPDIFTLSTNTLEANRYDLFPLHFVGNKSSRLAYGYSLLTKQYSLSEKGYNYWEQLRANSDPEGGLYEKQPLAVKGNMHNLTHPEFDVLGYFGATSVVSQRMFIKDVPDLPLDFDTYCNPLALRRGLREIDPSDYPGYLLGTEFGYALVLLNPECINCLLLGGSNVKPSFWPF